MLIVTNDDFDVPGMPALDPAPDEAAWEAFLIFALNAMKGRSDNGVSSEVIQAIEAASGGEIPFEVGLLLVMGVPDGDAWRRWGHDPANEWAEWRASFNDDVLARIEADGRWLEAWGERPAEAETRTTIVIAELAKAPPLMPLHDRCAVPLAVARDEESTSSNPVLLIEGTTVTTAGADLAAWLHVTFDVALPWWPDTPPRSFPFWSDLADS